MFYALCTYTHIYTHIQTTNESISKIPIPVLVCFHISDILAQTYKRERVLQNWSYNSLIKVQV